MKIKRFFAKDMRSALAEVKRTLGPDAVIMSSKSVTGGVELVAAYEPENLPQPLESTEPIRQNSVTPREELTGGVEKQQAIADSLDALLERQQAAQPAVTKPVVTLAPEAQTQPTLQTTDLNPINEAAKIETNVKTEAIEPVVQVGTRQVPEPAILNEHEVAQKIKSQAQQIERMNQDMAAIRDLLEFQVSGLMQQDHARREPMRALLNRDLTNLGIHPALAEQISCFIPEGLNREEAWQQTLDLLQTQIQTTQNDILSQGGVVALVGATGVGKTTTVAKLAARFARRHGPESVAMITTDSYRIGAAEQLQTYGRIIGCTVKVAKDAEELNLALSQLRQRKLILIDTAGMSQRDLRLTEQLERLMSASRLRIRPYLVLAATAQGAVQDEILKRFKNLSLSGCIITKVDECLSLGEALSASIQNRLPISYLTDGQRVPEDIKVADAGDLIARTEKLAVAAKSNQDNSWQWARTAT